MIAAAWMFVVVLATAAEATSPQGGLLGALFTFLFYGLLPLGIVLYIALAPHRRRARQLSEQRSAQSDGGDHAATGAVGSIDALAPVGKEALVAEGAPATTADPGQIQPL